MAVTGILPVIPTPLYEGRFDMESFEGMVAPMLASVDGLVLLGSTGEAPSFTTAERRAIAEKVLATVPGDKRVVVGVNSPSVGESIELAKHAEDHGAYAVLSSAPYYFLNSDDGMLRYFAALDNVLGIDLVIYDNPVTTKTTLSSQFVLRAAEQLEHLTAVKLTDHTLEKVAKWQDNGLTVLAGDDVILFHYLFSGVDGMMVIAPLLYPEGMAEVWRLVREQKPVEALAAFSKSVLPALHALRPGREIAATKEILACRGTIRSSEVLPPLVDVTSTESNLLQFADAICLGKQPTVA